jgi:hypothetical protein
VGLWLAIGAARWASLSMALGLPDSVCSVAGRGSLSHARKHGRCQPRRCLPLLNPHLTPHSQHAHRLLARAAPRPRLFSALRHASTRTGRLWHPV